MSVGRDAVVGVLPGFLGRIEQIPPMVSAIKVEGRKLYELAREGQEIERKPRSVEISELELTGFEPGEFPVMDFRVVCSSGTYVRTLADDIGRALGGRAHLTALRRTRIGSLNAEGAATMETLGEAGIEGALLPMAAGLADMAQIAVDDELSDRIAHGSVLDRADLPIEGVTAVVDTGGRLLAVYGIRDSQARPEVVVV